MNQRIEIIVSPNGQTRVETKGFAGGECLEASRFLETALGKKTSDERTSEFYATAESKNHFLEQET